MKYVGSVNWISQILHHENDFHLMDSIFIRSGYWKTKTVNVAKTIIDWETYIWNVDNGRETKQRKFESNVTIVSHILQTSPFRMWKFWTIHSANDDELCNWFSV